MNCMLDVTSRPLPLILTKTHIILANMKSYENDKKGVSKGLCIRRGVSWHTKLKIEPMGNAADGRICGQKYDCSFSSTVE